MSHHRIPLSIRRKFSTINKEKAFHITCDSCDKKFVVVKGKTHQPMQFDDLHLHSRQHDKLEDKTQTYNVSYYSNSDQLVATPIDDDTDLNQVKLVSTGYYMVAVKATNARHAKVIAESKMHQYFHPAKPKRAHWKDNFPFNKKG